jgi:hypothetical protein
MNHALETLANEVGLSLPANEPLRLTFGLACVERVRHLLEAPQVVACLDALGLYVRGDMDRATFDAARDDAAKLANQHPGSKSIDGTSHAAVSATYAVANALAGKALQAASYAAYATVYAYGGYAVRDADSFALEYAWQVNALRDLATRIYAS